MEDNRKKSLFLLLVIILIIGAFGFFLSSRKTTKSVANNTHIFPIKKAHASSVTPILTPTPIATQSPIPKIKISPTQALSGYCLNVPVLFYHHVQPAAEAIAHNDKSLNVNNDIFDSQMQYLVNQGYNTITAKQLIDALKSHTALPAKSIVITLDDGYKDNYTYAFPIFQKYHLTANIMLATGLMEGADYLTWAQVSEMKNSGLIYYTDHTWSHFAVNQGTAEKVQYEIQTGKQQIESHTGQSVDVFTYPYGAFNDLSINLLKQDGFEGAFSTMPGKTQCDSFIMTLHRTRIGNAPLSSYGI